MVSLPLVNLWNKRSLVFNFAWTDIKVRYKSTYLGLLWTTLEPLLLFVFMYIVFTSIRIRTGEDFAIYLLIGIILYHAFTRGTQGGMLSLRGNRSILSSINIRREFFPVATTVTAIFILFIEMGVFFGLMPFFDFVPAQTIIYLPIVLLLLVLLILGISYLLAIVHAYIKDIQPFWAVFVHAMFFVTPIFWYMEDASGIILEIQKLNPIGQLIEIAHQIVFGQIPPLNDWLYTTGIIVGILFVGYALFQRFEKNVMEQL